MDESKSFNVYVATFKKRPEGLATCKAVAAIEPGCVVVHLDESPDASDPIIKASDAFSVPDQDLHIDLDRVRIVRNWGDREICFLPISKQPGGLRLVPAGMRRQKETMDRFLSALEAASGQSIVTEDLMGRKMMLKVIGGLLAGAVLVMLILYLIRQ